MPTVKLKDKYNLEASIRKLKKLVEKAGITKEIRARERYIKPPKIKQKKIAASKKELANKIQKLKLKTLINNKKNSKRFIL